MKAMGEPGDAAEQNGQRGNEPFPGTDRIHGYSSLSEKIT